MHDGHCQVAVRYRERGLGRGVAVTYVERVGLSRIGRYGDTAWAIANGRLMDEPAMAVQRDRGTPRSASVTEDHSRRGGSSERSRPTTGLIRSRTNVRRIAKITSAVLVRLGAFAIGSPPLH
jgi:hypothetical protein